MTVYYRARHSLDESGDSARQYFECYVSIHETPHFAYCVYAGTYDCAPTVPHLADAPFGLPRLRLAKQRMVKVRRIDRHNSRFAFTDRAAAVAQFYYLKTRQLGHVERKARELRAVLAHMRATAEDFE